MHYKYAHKSAKFAEFTLVSRMIIVSIPCYHEAYNIKVFEVCACP